MTDQLSGRSLGQYEIRELIGQGGMARVYKAYQATLDRFVAIKAIPTQLDHAPDTDLLKSFYEEARLVARLTHPHIVPVHDFSEERDWAFIVMEYIAGGTVREHMVTAGSMGAQLALTWVLNVIGQAAQALDFAHANGIVHRDVKPGNMLLRKADFVLLSDFGIATILESSLAATRGGSTVGTPQYMAPEQGAAHGAVDGRTDIYSLGVVLFQCVTGRLPFSAETPVATIMKHIHEPLPDPAAFVPGLPPRVVHIIRRALEKDPNRRFQRASEMAVELQRAYDEERRAPRPGVAMCPHCGVSNNPQNRYCTRCGQELVGVHARVDNFLLPSGQPLRARLVFMNGPLENAAVVLHQDVITVGRVPGNDLVIEDGTISRQAHARIFFHNGAWYVEDRGSRNGTWLNNAPVAQALRLNHHDKLRMGDVLAIFEIVA